MKKLIERTPEWAATLLFVLGCLCALVTACNMAQGSSPAKASCSCNDCDCTPLNHCGCGGHHAKLVLGKATRKKEVPKQPTKTACPACGKSGCDCGCNEDPALCFCGTPSYKQAVKQAFKLDKPLAVFVNCKPKSIPNCLIAYEKELDGNSTPRVEFCWPAGDDIECFSIPSPATATPKELFLRWENYKHARRERTHTPQSGGISHAPPFDGPVFVPEIPFLPPTLPMFGPSPRGFGFGGGFGGGRACIGRS